MAEEILPARAAHGNGLRERRFKGLESRSNGGCGSGSDLKILN